MRVIAGRFRGRVLRSPKGRGTRPTSDRVRESVFSVLGDAVDGARVLDLWAGTGALALEAISRGAASATCVERGRGPLAALDANVEALGVADRVRVVRGDALAFARGAAAAEPTWDVVFCDPPYGDPLEPLEREVVGGDWWDAVCVVEHAARVAPPAAPAGVRADTRTYGDSAVTFYWRA